MKHTFAALILSVIPMLASAQAERAPRLHWMSNYGFFVGYGTETGLPDLVPTKDLSVKLISPDACYTAPSEVLVEVVDAEGTLVSSQTLTVPASKVVRIPAAAMQGGDVYVSAQWGEPEEYASTDYQMAFSDEFDGEDGSKPYYKRWRRTPHDNNSAWNRYVNSKSEKVVYVADGDLVTRCIPCAPEDLANNENRPWMSGAVDTKGKYAFQYGRVDVRAITNPFRGSFPAIWMMPSDQTLGWPKCGEIDIWEMIDTGALAYGTVHAAIQSQKSGFTVCNYDGRYHVYTFEWTAEKMVWSIDGKMAYSSYWKDSLTDEQLKGGYWPFDKKFYLILNQSVGNGSWAKDPVEGHEYETRFDFVRIYQTKEQNSRVGIDDVVINDGDNDNSHRAVFDLQGRLLTTAPTSGIYICGGKKVIR